MREFFSNLISCEAVSIRKLLYVLVISAEVVGFAGCAGDPVIETESPKVVTPSTPSNPSTPTTPSTPPAAVAHEKGFIWSGVDGFTQIPTPSNAENLSPTGINNLGQVIGFLTLHDGQGDDRAFIWSANDGLQRLGSLVGADGISWALTIDDNGEVRGLSEGPSTRQGPGRPHISDAFFWTASNGMKPAASAAPESFKPVSQGGKLILLPGDDCMELVRTTSAGFAIGYSGSVQNGTCKLTSALLWQVDGTPVTIVEGCGPTCAHDLKDIIILNDVNNRGEVIGSSPGWGGFRWTPSGKVFPIPDEVSYVSRINDNGDAVGLVDTGRELKLFLWLASGQMVGIPLPDSVKVESLAGINNRGQIVGTFR
jgi:probable HAF family extracellular repeat protein